MKYFYLLLFALLFFPAPASAEVRFWYVAEAIEECGFSSSPNSVTTCAINDYFNFIADGVYQTVCLEEIDSDLPDYYSHTQYRSQFECIPDYPDAEYQASASYHDCPDGSTSVSYIESEGFICNSPPPPPPGGCEAPLVDDGNGGCSCPAGTELVSAAEWGIPMDQCLEPCPDGASRQADMSCSCPSGQTVNELLNQCTCPDLSDTEQVGMCNPNNCSALGQVWSSITNQCIDPDDCLTGDPDGDGTCGCPPNTFFYEGSCTSGNCIYDASGKMLCDKGDGDKQCVTDSQTGAQYCLDDPDNCITNDEGKTLCAGDLDRDKDGSAPDPTSDDCSQDLNNYQTQCTTGCAANGGVLSFNGSCSAEHGGGYMTSCTCNDGTTPTSDGSNNPTSGDGSGDSQTSGDTGAIVQSNLDGAQQVSDRIGSLEGQLQGVNDNLSQGLGALNGKVQTLVDSLNGSGNVEVPTLGEGGLSAGKDADSLDTVIQQYKDDTDLMLTELNTKFDQYTADLKLNFLPDLTGSSGCPSAGSATTSMVGTIEFDFCKPEYMQAWEIIRSVLLLIASIIALFILFRPSSRG